jgi:alkanesulfonate monooxygenase SsuD/methylene tetrahydromethanopterin reductase-like flavin-dependent oxidoreductase (luciferase family)
MRSILACLCACTFLVACGPESGTGTPKTSSQLAAQEAEGKAVAEAVLTSYSEAVDELVALLKDKPAPADVLPKVQAVLAKRVEAAKALRVRFLALAPGPALQAASRTLSDKRPPTVARKDQLLGAIVFHYRGVAVSPEIVDAIEKQLIGLIDAPTAPR